jgi:hypothetical protein
MWILFVVPTPLPDGRTAEDKPPTPSSHSRITAYSPGSSAMCRLVPNL